MEIQVFNMTQVSKSLLNVTGSELPPELEKTQNQLADQVVRTFPDANTLFSGSDFPMVIVPTHFYDQQ